MAPSAEDGAVSGSGKSLAQSIVEHRYFEPFIACVITFNCIELAWQSPLDPPGTWKADFIDACEKPLLYIFTFEMVAKMIAWGLFHNKHSYLRDPWSILDFFVVMSAWCALPPSLESMTCIPLDSTRVPVPCALHSCNDLARNASHVHAQGPLHRPWCRQFHRPPSRACTAPAPHTAVRAGHAIARFCDCPGVRPARFGAHDLGLCNGDLWHSWPGHL